MDEDGVLIEPSDNVEEMIESWLAYEGESVGYCFVCDSPIKTEFDIIPGTNDHRCERKRPRADDVGRATPAGSFSTPLGDRPDNAS